MKVNYRAIARETLRRAKAEMASGDPDRLPYAALELRKTMEAVTYERAQLYKDEIPPDLYRTWQPPKVVRYITEIDWMTSFGSWQVAIGFENHPNQPAVVLGTETLLTGKNIRDHYNALGAFLHVPTPDQIDNNKLPDPARLEDHCRECVIILDKILTSPISRVRFGVFARTECFRCGSLMAKRLVPNSTEPVETSCINCGAEYIISDEGQNKVSWSPKKLHELKCPTEKCTSAIKFWEDEIRSGVYWTCDECKETYEFDLRIVKSTHPSPG